jgi:hypothetical protein
MDPGSEPVTEGEKADLEGIAAIKESAAREYTKAITQMGALSILNPDGSVLFANHCRALDDAEQAIRLAPSNIKVRYPSPNFRIWCRGPPLMCDIRVARSTTGKGRTLLLSTFCQRRSPSPGWGSSRRIPRNFL